MKWVNIETQSQTIPAIIDGTMPPRTDQLTAAGWRLWDEAEPAIPDGMEVLGRSFAQDPDNPMRAVVVHALGSISERQATEAAAAQARLAAIAPSASLFRATLRKHFGDGAETNRDVTAASVAAHFMAAQASGTIMAAELADAVVLDKLFVQIAAFTGTGETWSFFEQYGEAIP